MSSDVFPYKVEIPLLEIKVNDPFRVSLREVLVEPISDLRVEVTLPPILPVEVPLITEDLVGIRLLEEIFQKGFSFEDILTAVPMISGELVRLPVDSKSMLEAKLKYLRRVAVAGTPKTYGVEVRPLETRRVPDELRDRFTIRLRIRRELSPELRELIEKRLTKELRLTRLVKRMEIVRDPRSTLELEIYLMEIERRLGLRRLAGRPPRREH